jgi:hypothetical protein
MAELYLTKRPAAAAAAGQGDKDEDKGSFKPPPSPIEEGFRINVSQAHFYRQLFSWARR